MTHSNVLLALSAAASVVACAPAVATTGATTAPASVASVPATNSARGTLFIVGGGSQSRDLVNQFITLAGGPGHARIAVLPMASAEAASSGKEKADELRGLGADAFVVNVTREEADADSVVRLLNGATGIWFPGGDQSRLTARLQGSAALRAIHDRYRAGAVIGGTSAGAAIMSDSMLTGNQFFPGLTSAVDSGASSTRVARRTIEVIPGLGLLHNAIVDQHFIRRQRENRLLSVIMERPALLGVGIDEGTALRVDPDGRWSVLGASAVIVFDARSSRITSPTAPRLGALDIHVSVLPAGSTFNPRTGRATLPSTSTGG